MTHDSSFFLRIKCINLFISKSTALYRIRDKKHEKERYLIFLKLITLSSNTQIFDDTWLHELIFSQLEKDS